MALLVIETAFSDREKALAARSLHLAPSVLATELDQITPGKRFPVYITHTKPAETGLIMEEIQRFDHVPTQPGDTRARHPLAQRRHVFRGVSGRFASAAASRSGCVRW